MQAGAWRSRVDSSRVGGDTAAMAAAGIDRVTRLVALFTLVLVALLLTGGWVFHALLARGLADSSRRHLDEQGRLIAAALAADPEGPLEAWRRLDPEALRSAATLDRLELHDGNGRPLAEDPLWPARELPDSLIAALRLGLAVAPPPQAEGGELFQSLSLPLAGPAGELAAILVLESGEAVSTQLQALRRGLWTATGLGAGFVVFVLVAMALILRQARRRQRELDRAEHLAEVGTLAAGLAHEIRNPLAIIAGHAELFELQRSGDPDEAARRAGEIVAETERLRRLLDDFLSFARPSDLRLRPLAALEVWGRLVEEQRQLHPSLRFELAAPPALPPLTADSDRLRQLALNLLANAALAAGPGGLVRVELFAQGEWLRSVIRDSGPGVPAALVPRLFAPFVSGREGGTGLGLAVCAAIARAHGGSLRLSANGPGGAEFTLELPLAAAGPAKETA